MTLIPGKTSHSAVHSCNTSVGREALAYERSVFFFYVFACFQRVNSDVVKCRFWTSSHCPHVLFMCWWEGSGTDQICPIIHWQPQTPAASRSFVFMFCFSEGKSHKTTLVVNEWQRGYLAKGSFRLYILNLFFTPCFLPVSYLKKV